MRNIFFLLFFFLTPLWSDETIIEEQTYNYWGEFVNMLFTLAFVIILIIVSVWFLKKIMRSRVKSLNLSNGIKILERRPLGPKASLYLVDVLGKGLVISDSPSGVQLISEFTDSVNIEELLAQRQEEKKPHVPFREILANKLKKRNMQKNA